MFAFFSAPPQIIQLKEKNKHDMKENNVIVSQERMTQQHSHTYNKCTNTPTLSRMVTMSTGKRTATEIQQSGTAVSEVKGF